MARAPEAEALPEPDRVEGAPHPRETTALFGQSAAEAAFLDAFHRGRLAHGWLLTGPRGVGKATLAWRIARFLLATPEEDGGLFTPPPPVSLDVPADHPVARRIAALSEGRLFLVRRGRSPSTDRPATEILVEEVRKLKSFFQLSAPDGGRRVVIVDAADEMNVAAANAILKILEEPPPKVTMLLISHQPFRLLPTIRSRCREVRLAPLAPGDMAQALAATGEAVDDPAALAELASGSVGEALRLLRLDGVALYAQVTELMATLPRMDRPRALALAEKGAGRDGEAAFDTVLRLIDLFLTRLARTGATGRTPPEAARGETALLRRLAPDAAAARAWADLAQTLSLRARRGKAVNLDPAALLMDMVLKIDETAGTLAQR